MALLRNAQCMPKHAVVDFVDSLPVDPEIILNDLQMIKTKRAPFALGDEFDEVYRFRLK
jgi:hypothetical protein